MLPHLRHGRERNGVRSTPPSPASDRRDHRRPRLARHVRQLDLIAVCLVVIFPPGFPSRNRGGVQKGGGREDVERMNVYIRANAQDKILPDTILPADFLLSKGGTHIENGTVVSERPRQDLSTDGLPLGVCTLPSSSANPALKIVRWGVLTYHPA